MQRNVPLPFNASESGCAHLVNVNVGVPNGKKINVETLNLSQRDKHRAELQYKPVFVLATTVV